MTFISCNCGKCKIFLNYSKILYSLFCACEDCRQAAEWGFIKGGLKPDKLQKLIYFRSDLSKVSGKKWMHSFQLRQKADSTRIYCTNCYSIIGIDHTNYNDTMFMLIPKLCKVNIDTSITPIAAIQMQDYIFDDKQNLSKDIKFIETYDPLLTKSYKLKYSKPEGISFKNLISQIRGPKILNLKKGERLI